MKGILAGLAAVVLVAPAGSGRTAPRPEVVVVFGPPEANCPTGALRRSTIREIAAHPAQFSRKCVRVRGVWAGNALYEDLDAYRRYGGGYDVYDPAAAPAHARIGVYAPRDLVERRGAGEAIPIRADMVARVGDCDELWRGGALAAGYCRANRGAFLAVHDADVAPVRQPGD